MKKATSILALLCTITFTSCNQTPPCEVSTNGFLTGADYKVKMGSSEAVEVFKQLDAAWAKLDYDAMRTFIAEEASFSFADGFVATGPQEFVDKIKGFQKGGAVSKGQPIVVGEQGAELFIPNSSGQITQSARGTGGGATTVNFNINTVDASGFEELLVRSRGTITQLINNAVNERGSKNLI